MEKVVNKFYDITGEEITIELNSKTKTTNYWKNVDQNRCSHQKKAKKKAVYSGRISKSIDGNQYRTILGCRVGNSSATYT